MHHYITKYKDEHNQLVVESWIQLNFLFWSFCFSKRKLVIK